jgi:hypothetical protein
MEDLPTNIKDYIIKSRQTGLPDSKIVETLKNSNWPDDIINTVLKEADLVVPAAPEQVIEDTQQENVQENTVSEMPLTENKKNLPNNLENNQTIKQEDKKEKKRFCYLTLLSLLFSPIPFIGLGIAMSSFERIKKNNMSGAFIAVIGLLINIGVILFILYFIVQLLTVSPSQLEGISKTIVEKLGIL